MTRPSGLPVALSTLIAVLATYTALDLAGRVNAARGAIRLRRGSSAAPSPNSATGDYRYISITDPGNAEGVITVAATHRLMPHTSGVSYFSSRGPTGDGRNKPDLVAPGESLDG